MALPERAAFTADCSAAIAEASAIINKVKADPTAYVRQEISTWGAKWCSCRLFGYSLSAGKSKGVFDIYYYDAFDAVHQAHPSATLNALDSSVGDREATGDSKNADAASRRLDNLSQGLSKERLDAQYDLYEGNTNVKVTDTIASAVFNSVWFFAMEGFYVLYNTMLKHMDQGLSAPLVPGPGEHIEITNTPMGAFPRIVKDSVPVLPDDSKLISQITVAQFRLLMKDILGLQ